MDVMRKILLLILSALLLAGCSVKEQEMEITVFNQTVSAVYTGKVKRKLPNGEGAAQLAGSAAVDGVFEEGAFVSGNADNVPYDVTYLEESVSGTYTGEVAEQLPSGTGVFSSDTFSYDGTWTNGVPDGTGSITTDRFRITAPDGDLEGSYTGEVSNGLAEGAGTFLYPDGNSEIRMEGNFAKNQFDGTMVKTIRYQDTERAYPVYYQNGKPVYNTVSIIAYLEGMRNESYCLSEEQLAFINEHASLFEGKADAPDKYNDVFEYDAFTENDTPALIRIDNAVIKSVQRFKPFDGADTVTSMIVQNYDGWYHLIFAYAVEEADEGETMNFCALPLCRTTITAPEEDYPAIDAAAAAVTNR